MWLRRSWLDVLGALAEIGGPSVYGVQCTDIDLLQTEGTTQPTDRNPYSRIHSTMDSKEVHGETDIRPSIFLLDTLPIEILRQILGGGSCRTALAFARVNRKCRAVCNDVQLFKSMSSRSSQSQNTSMPHWNSHVVICSDRIKTQ